jgi:predicted DNA-binding protein (MmcQ/YjbR family)
MELEALQAHLSAKSGAVQEHPFGPEAMVYKVAGKMFALIAWEETPLRITLKCDPVEAIALRQEYPAITPGYHMNKKWWNTIRLDGSVSEVDLVRMMDDSYDLVFEGLPKKTQAEVGRGA